jgi:hypothetical protein
LSWKASDNATGDLEHALRVTDNARICRSGAATVHILLDNAAPFPFRTVRTIDRCGRLLHTIDFSNEPG